MALAISRSALSEMTSIVEQIAAGADDAPAISAPERDALTHGALRRAIVIRGWRQRVLHTGLQRASLFPMA